MHPLARIEFRLLPGWARSYKNKRGEFESKQPRDGPAEQISLVVSPPSLPGWMEGNRNNDRAVARARIPAVPVPFICMRHPPRQRRHRGPSIIELEKTDNPEENVVRDERSDERHGPGAGGAIAVPRYEAAGGTVTGRLYSVIHHSGRRAVLEGTPAVAAQDPCRHIETPRNLYTELGLEECRRFAGPSAGKRRPRRPVSGAQPRPAVDTAAGKETIEKKRNEPRHVFHPTPCKTDQSNRSASPRPALYAQNAAGRFRPLLNTRISIPVTISPRLRIWLTFIRSPTIAEFS